MCASAAPVPNYLGLNGIDFVEFASPNPEYLHKLFMDFGFSHLMRHRTKKIDYYRQNDIHFFINYEKSSFGSGFHKLHGPSICSMGWRVDNATMALKTAQERGAKVSSVGDFVYDEGGKSVPSIYGIGDSLIYLIENASQEDRYSLMGFEPLESPEVQEDRGFLLIDHLTNNVAKGQMEKWSKFYKEVFGFQEVRYFDIKGEKTGLTSYALRSPCGKFCIPINEGNEEKSQINEYLNEYHGPGIQHLAFLTNDILKSLQQMKNSSIETLTIDDDYYDEVFDRVPNVTEDHKTIQDYQVLVDGDDEGYLLQIFTKNVVGPIFIEIIQRKNHHSFGEGNFGALFRAIERDQEERGVI